jgi:CBS domain-containing protein
MKKNVLPRNQTSGQTHSRNGSFGPSHPPRLRPEAVLLCAEVDAESAAVLERVQASGEWQFLVVDDDGRPVGVLRRVDVYRALVDQRGH